MVYGELLDGSDRRLVITVAQFVRMHFSMIINTYNTQFSVHMLESYKFAHTFRQVSKVETLYYLLQLFELNQTVV